MNLLGAVKRAAQVDADAAGAQPGPGTSAVHAIALPGTAVSPGAPLRNGHARVVGRLVELLLAENLEGDRSRTAQLSLVDEISLKDGDEAQLGANGLAVAREGTVLEWRAALTVYFQRRYGLAVRFDARQTTVSAAEPRESEGEEPR